MTEEVKTTPEAEVNKTEPTISEVAAQGTQPEAKKELS